MKLKFFIPIAGAVLVIGAGAGTVAAKTLNHGPQTPDVTGYQVSNNTTEDGSNGPWYCGGYGNPMGFANANPVTPQVAALLGTTAADLETRLSSGQTLSDIASATGVNQDQLVQTVMSPYQDHLDLMVKYGYLTQEQSDNLARQARSNIQTMITSPLNSNNDWDDYMGGMMYSWGGQPSSQQPDTSPDTDGENGGYGGMMGGYSGGFGGMMGGW